MPAASSDLEAHGVKALWYLTHIDNLPSMLNRGILSHTDVARLNVDHSRIDSRWVQQKRNRSIECNGRHFHLHDRVPVFFATHQPMLYVQKNRGAVAHLELDLRVFALADVIFSDGNASQPKTRFFSDARNLAELDWRVIHTPNCHTDTFKWRKAAEVLLSAPVDPQYIRRIHVRDDAAQEAALKLVPFFASQIVVSSDLYPAEKITSPSNVWSC